MNSLKELKKLSRPYIGALLSDDILPHRVTERCSRYLTLLFEIVLVAAAIHAAVSSFPVSPEIASLLKDLAPNVYGTLFIVAGAWILTLLLEGFYHSYYFRNESTVLPEFGLRKKRPIDYETAAVLHSLSETDVTGGFLSSHIAKVALSRLGIARDDVRAFLRSPRTPVVGAEFVFPEGKDVSVRTLSETIYQKDRDFAGMLAKAGVSGTDFAGAVDWIVRLSKLARKEERWWGKDKLGRIQGIGKQWAYGATFRLEKYAVDITFGLSRTVIARTPKLKEDADELEGVLSRSREANAVLVGEEGGPRMEVVYQLAERIASGSVLPPLEHKRLLLLDGVSFVSSSKDKAAFETELTLIMDEAIKAGNIILAVSDFARFLEVAKALESDALSLFEPYLTSSRIQFIAIASPEEFQRALERNEKFKKLFEKVSVHELDDESLILLLEDEVIRIEATSPLYFTFPALRVIAEGASRYFSGSVGSDKVVDLLLEMAPYMAEQKRRVVTREDALELLTRKTGIPLGEASEEEKTKLLNLEAEIGKRIIGQKEAVESVANAMRRARSGVGSPKRPMGSFLFLGPTGVGKTETTKVLAHTFFGSEDAIIRLDMSEYKGPDSMGRLIGSAETSEPGVLAAKLREKPYGVLLLDEFEKANKEVLDLFLQVLDEGFFSDVYGKRVNVRNCIIVATSNAGSDLIWDMMKKGDLNKKRIIDEVIARGIYKPELLNRFDGVVVFRPLGDAELREIARIMLKKLQSRLMEKGIELVITDALLDMLVKEGSDPKFGARPISRAIQEKVEQVIATKMLQGEIRGGSRVELAAENTGT